MPNDHWRDATAAGGGVLGIFTALGAWLRGRDAAADRREAAQERQDEAKASRLNAENVAILEQKDKDIDYLRKYVDRVVPQRDYRIQQAQFAEAVALGMGFHVRRIVYKAERDIEMLCEIIKRAGQVPPEIEPFPPIPDDETLAQRKRPFEVVPP